MRLTMKVIQGPHRHEVFEFQAPATFAVGRGVDCAVPLPKDGLCTRQHLIVDLSPEGCVLNHKGRHDTFVNGVKVSESCILAEQATIRFGRTTIHAELLPAATTAPIPPPVHRGHSAAAQSDDLTEMASFPDLENYEYLQALGQGSAGWVCHMRHRHTGQQVAMKVLKPSRDPLQWKRFKEERRVLEGLNHPHVARFVGGGEKNGAWYHLLEYIAGPNLRGLRESRADGLSPREAVTIMVQALEGLHHVHECGILHRDIKPENIVVEGQWPDYRAVVTDFGFGKIEAGPQNPAGETLTLPDTVMGTLPFMQPDLLFGRPRDARSDVFAAAATLYWALTGEYLYYFPPDRLAVDVVAEQRFIPLARRLSGYPELCAVVDQGLGLGSQEPCGSAWELRELLLDLLARRVI